MQYTGQFTMYGSNKRYKVIFIGAVQYKAKTGYLCNFFEPFSKNIKSSFADCHLYFHWLGMGPKMQRFNFLNLLQYICLILNIIPVMHYAKTYTSILKSGFFSINALLFFRGNIMLTTTGA